MNATMLQKCWPLRRRPSKRRIRRWRGPWWVMSRLNNGAKRRSSRGNALSPSCRCLSDLRFSTLENAYSKIIASLVNTQQEHVNLADELSIQVVAVLVSLARKNEGHRKKASRGSLWPLVISHSNYLASAILPESSGR